MTILSTSFSRHLFVLTSMTFKYNFVSQLNAFFTLDKVIENGCKNAYLAAFTLYSIVQG